MRYREITVISGLVSIRALVEAPGRIICIASVQNVGFGTKEEREINGRSGIS